ncbi:hypothetical protein SLA2020_033870 [Shorea laevis]
MTSQSVEPNKVLEVPEERNQQETFGEAQRKKKRSKALSSPSRDTLAAYKAKLAKLEFAIEDIHELLETLESRIKE